MPDLPVTSEIFNLESLDGTLLIGRSWKPAIKPASVICLIHGLGDHSGRYNAWAHRFCQQGIVVLAIDYRGNGLSPGKRGHVNHLDDLLNDTGALVHYVRKSFAGIPIFIYGHSMGGNLVLSYLLNRSQDFAGAIVTSPWLALVKPPSSLILQPGKVLNRIYPGFTMKTGVKAAKLSGIEENQQSADKDPLMHGRISIRTFLEIEKSAEEIMAKSGNINIPVLICHGDADNVTRHDFSRKLSESHQVMFKLLTYRDGLHELHNETVANELFDDIFKWLFLNIKNTSEFLDVPVKYQDNE